MCILRSVTRFAVIGGLLAGTAVLVAGPQRVGAVASQLRTAVNDRIDSHIDDPVVAKQQLEQLAAQYPKQLSVFRTELGQLQEQIAELTREKQVSNRVVEMAKDDLTVLQDRIARAESARSEHPFAEIRIGFAQDQMSLDEAYTKATQVARTVQTYEARTAHAADALNHLVSQEATISSLIEELEAEHAQFQAQLWQLESEIELMERQEKLVDMVERRQRAIDGFEKYEAGSLDALMNRIDRMRAEQDARLKAATTRKSQTSYEDRARTMLEGERAAKDMYERTLDLPAIEGSSTDGIFIDGEDEESGEDDDETDQRVAQLTIR